MADNIHPSRLDRISTSWTLLEQARSGPTDAATAARCLLVERYRGAVRRYLGALLRDDHAADDLTQEFGLKLIEGKLSGADPERGRFRNYVKAVLASLVSRHRKKQQRQPQTQSAPETQAPNEAEQIFLQSWREELLVRTWEALAQTHATFFTVLHFRATHADMAMEEMIPKLNPQLSKTLNLESLRQTLHRARALFADLLIGEVAQSLTQPTQAQIEEELGELNLLEYCRPALERKGKRSRRQA
jgi:RNA polymerase sigma-70 factor (ECF subfamily)